jgi:hypothetical protein
MSATLTARRSGLDPIAINDRRREIHQSWSPAEREYRAAVAKQKLAALLMLIDGEDEEELAAVGAPACEDLQRMAG